MSAVPIEKTEAPPSSDLYGPDYYASHCGPVPYDRAHPQWMSFFGSIADELIRVFRPVRMFDAGCAHGFLVEAFWDRGVEARGRDISSFAISQVRPDVRPFCAVGSLAEPIEGEYDLITCIEVLEHMPEAEGIRAIANMTAVTDRIVFSSSPTDLVEPTHVNLKPAIYWLHLFAAHGFAPLVSVMLPSITPYALAFERSETGRGERDLLACAELVRLRLQIAALNGVVQDRDRSIAEANTQLATRNETVDRLGQELAQHCQSVAALSDQLAERERTISAQERTIAEAGNELDKRTGEHDATARELNEQITKRNETVDRLGQELAQHRQSVAALSDQLADRERTITTQIERIASVEQQLRDCEGREAELRGTIAQLQDQYAAILASSVWQATRPIRTAAGAIPRPLRRFMRRGVKLAWWSVTLQLPRRIRERNRALGGGQDAVAALQPAVADIMARPVREQLVPSADRDVILAAGLFDEDWYCRSYPDVGGCQVFCVRRSRETLHVVEGITDHGTSDQGRGYRGTAARL